MSKPDVLKRSITSCALIVLGMLISWAVMSGGAAKLVQFARPAQAQAPAVNPLFSTAQHDSSSSAAQTVFYQCVSKGVSVFSSRIHVECTQATPGGIRFFALGTTNSSHTARILSVLSMAHVTAKPLWIEYDSNDTSGTAIGCLASDCRLIVSAGILQ